MDLILVFKILAISLFILIVVFSTITITYKGDDKKNVIPIDLLNNRQPTGLRKGITQNNISKMLANNNARLSYNNNSNNNTLSSITNNISQKVNNDVNKYNSAAPKYGLYGIPEKDKYMSPLFREQIDNLQDKYYYDNCKYSSL